jgi:hypothetical protein
MEHVVVGVRELGDADLQMRIVRLGHASFQFVACLPQKAGTIPPCVIVLDADQIMLLRQRDSCFGAMSNRLTVVSVRAITGAVEIR